MSKAITVNGKERHFSDGPLPQDLRQLLERMGVNEATVVAEVDGRIVERKNFAATKLSAGQSVELIRFVGGG